MKNIRKALLAITLAIPLCLQAQVSSTHVVTYDFESGEVYDLKPVKYHDFVIVKIININTFRYGVSIEGRRVDYTTPMPTELQAVFRVQNDYGNGSESSEDDIEEGLTLVNGAQIAMGDETKKIKEEVDKEKEIERNAAANVAAGIAGAVLAPADANLIRLNEKMKNLEKVCKLFLLQSRKIARIRYSRTELISISKQNWKKHSELQRELFKIKVDSRDQMRNDFVNYYELYAQAEVAYEQAIAAARAAGKTDELKAIQDASEKLEESYTRIKAEHYLQLIEDVRTLYDALKNKNNFTVISAPVQMTADIAEFEISLTPMPSNALLPIEQVKTAVLEVATCGGVKVDFSVGPAAIFKTNTATLTSIYEIVPDPTDNTQELVNEITNNDVLRPATAAYMHVMTRRNDICSYGLLFGIGADFQSIEDANLSLYSGVTIGLGKTQRVYFSGGLSFYRTNELTLSDPSLPFAMGTYNISDITRPTMQSGAFISVSYALANRVQIQ